jgi:hypothetical protein
MLSRQSRCHTCERATRSGAVGVIRRHLKGAGFVVMKRPPIGGGRRSVAGMRAEAGKTARRGAPGRRKKLA